MIYIFSKKAQKTLKIYKSLEEINTKPPLSKFLKMEKVFPILTTDKKIYPKYGKKLMN